jgi:hypothetical protein
MRHVTVTRNAWLLGLLFLAAALLFGWAAGAY